MWAKAIAKGRCLVPVRAFYESSAIEKGPDARRPAGPSAASTTSASPAPALSCSLPSSRTDASPSSPRSPARASPRFTTACRSSLAQASPSSGSALISRGLRIGAPLGLRSLRNEVTPEPYRCNRRFCISTKVAQPFTGRCSICRPALDVKVNALLFAEIAHLVGGILIERISILI